MLALLLVLAAPKLTADERKLLEGLYPLLADPRGAERVVVKTINRHLAGGWTAYREHCWRLPSTTGRRRIVDRGGVEVSHRSGVKPIDFVAEVRARLAKPGDRPLQIEEAAWLLRLGEEALAARVLADLDDSKEDAAYLRCRVCSKSCESMVAHMQAGGDRRAKMYGERAESSKAGDLMWLPWMREVLADLRRREKDGTLGKRKPMPDGFARLPQARRIAWLIDALDDLALSGKDTCLGTLLGPHDDPRYRALVAEGDAAVPALIDAVEKDARVTRSLRGVTWTELGTHPGWHFRSVAETAHDILMGILQAGKRLEMKLGADWQIGGRIDDKKFADGKNIDPKGRAATVARLRAYWREFGKLPFLDRQIAHLNDAKAKPEVLEDAADDLSSRILGLPGWDPKRKGDGRVKEVKAFLARHKLRPLSAAEAAALVPSWSRPSYVPDIRPLGRAATEADVAAGRAVFHLAGKGKKGELPVPALIDHKGEKGIVVQAEEESGRMTYGVVFRHEIRRVAR